MGNSEGAPLVLFALPDEATRENNFEIAIPKLGSLIITRDPNGEVRGLNEYVGEHPPVAPVFWAFRIMVGIGMAMIVVGLVGAWMAWRRDHLPRWALRGLVGMGFRGGWRLLPVGM